MTEKTDSGIVIDWLDGNCPVQAEGTIDGRRFYFRARGEHWSIEVHPAADLAAGYLEWPSHGSEVPGYFEYRERWGNGPYEAGWMPDDIAVQMIAKGAELYREGLQ